MQLTCKIFLTYLTNKRENFLYRTTIMQINGKTGNLTEITLRYSAQHSAHNIYSSSYHTKFSKLSFNSTLEKIKCRL